MERLTTLDEIFLHVENEEVKMHIGVCLIFELPSQDFIQQLLQSLPQYIRDIPHGTERLKRAWRPLGRWAWEADPAFDPHNHIRAMPLAAPGDRQALEALVCELQSQPLDYQRPLWQMTLITGLTDNRFALYLKIHHCCIDGISGVNRIYQILSTDPDPQAAKSHITPKLARRSMPVPRQPLTRFGKLALLLRGVRTLIAQLRSGQSRMLPRSAEVPDTLFNTQVSAARSFTALELPLEQIRQVAQRAHCTINDVLCVMIGNAMKAYLQAHGQILDRSLVAMMPVSVHTKDTAFKSNRIGNLFLPLHSHHSDPVIQLKALHTETEQAKAQILALPQEVVTGMMALGAIPLLLARKHKPGAGVVTRRANVVISNVRGPTHQLYLQGARLLAIHPIAVLSPTCALNVTTVSYAGTLNIGVVADGKVAPGIAQLGAQMLATLEQIEHALGLGQTAACQVS